MAKRKSKKSNTTSLVIGIIVIALAVLTICTLFMPVFTSKTDSLLGATSSNITGGEVVKSLFQGDYLTESGATGVNAMIALRKADESAFVTVVFGWAYFITVLVSAAVVVFAILSLLGLKFKLTNTILGAGLVVLAVVTFIFAIVVAGKFGSVDLGSIVTSKTVIGVGIYMLIATLIIGGAEIYNARK